MSPIELTDRPPREPRAEVGGIIFLPRSIDKARASLPGGDIGEYDMTGLTGTMLEMLDISEEAFVEAVRMASNDEDVVAFVKARSSQAKIDAWNAFILGYVAFRGDATRIRGLFPWFEAERATSMLALDLLYEDDHLAFRMP